MWHREQSRRIACRSTIVAPAKVENCTVVGLGAGPGGATLYASRLFIKDLPDSARAILELLVHPENV